ncbi:MAG: SUMF1/EgtB/PvdO family nonheme iron enzyme [Polyangiaceae bacterium]|nr:SUMF1/EgtB/PvdO family nonheme iron enzyme [Polyangiaceae bacterium]
MVEVPAGTFWMGCAPGDTQCKTDEKPRHRVRLDAFLIDRNEVSVREFMLCVHAKRCNERLANSPSRQGASSDWKVPGRADHPMDCGYKDAEDYCEWRGKRLPTEAEWEFAARGTDERILPWGKGNPPSPLCWNQGTSCPVGSHSNGASPFGVLDMAGNVAEWVSDTYHPAYYAESPQMNPKGPVGPIPVQHQVCSGHCPVVRGGSWASPEADLRATARTYSSQHVGFRCARSGKAPPANP